MTFTTLIRITDSQVCDCRFLGEGVILRRGEGMQGVVVYFFWGAAEMCVC